MNLQKNGLIKIWSKSVVSLKIKNLNMFCYWYRDQYKKYKKYLFIRKNFKEFNGIII